MKSLIVLGGLLAAVASGCASANITQRQVDVGNQKLARPDRIVVYDLAATAADVPAWSAGAAQFNVPSAAPTDQQIAFGRKLGDEVGKRLVDEIREMGLPAEESADGAPPRVGDIAIVGYFESVDEGSEVKRIALGFGSGSADLKTRVEAYQMTPRGPRLLGSEDIDSGGGKSPGMVIPVVAAVATANPIGIAVAGAAKIGMEAAGEGTIEGAAKQTADEIAKQLRVGFERQGWI